jgi:hypothetical protein
VFIRIGCYQPFIAVKTPKHERKTTTSELTLGTGLAIVEHEPGQGHLLPG